MTRSGNKRTTNKQLPTTNNQLASGNSAGQQKRQKRQHCVDICQLNSESDLAIWSSSQLSSHPGQATIWSFKAFISAKRGFLAGFLFLGKSQFCVFSLVRVAVTRIHAQRKRPAGSWQSPPIVVSLPQSSGGFKFISSFGPENGKWGLQPVMMGISIYLNVWAALGCHDWPGVRGTSLLFSVTNYLAKLRGVTCY